MTLIWYSEKKNKLYLVKTSQYVGIKRVKGHYTLVFNSRNIDKTVSNVKLIGIL